MSIKHEYRIISGEGAGPGTIETAWLTDIGVKRRLTRERCNGDRWARAFYRIASGLLVFVDFETGEARAFPY